jgi:CRP-like cAMP-binding protein/predicted MFS family arabinose efflux permease
MTPPSPKDKPTPLSVFRNRNFTWLWSGQLVSTIGDSLMSLAASIFIFRETGSALSVGLMLVATSAPSLLVGLVAGVYVDRMDRKRIMIVANLLQGVLVVLIPFLITVHIAWLYIIVALISAIGQFFTPAQESVLPEVATDEELAAANSFMAISSFGSTAIGFAASGLIASQLDIAWAFYIDGFTFLLSALFIFFVRITPLEVKEKTNFSVIIRNLKAGGRFLFENSVLRSLFIIAFPVYLSLGLWNSLLLPFAIRALDATELEFGIQEGMTSIGFVIGSLLMAQIADRWREGQWISLSYIVMGALGIVYSQVVSIPFAIVLVTISGFMNAPSAIARKLAVQRNTTREVRGRINSTFFVLRDIIFILGMGAAGFADIVDVRWLILVSAILLLGAGALALVLPGLGRPAAEWRRSLSLLRAAPAEVGMDAGRPATLADFDRLVGHMPVMSGLKLADREAFIENTKLRAAPSGTKIIQHGETGDDVYFILEGEAVAGVAVADDKYRSLSSMGAGDFFGEIAALTGEVRTADVVADQETTLLEVPAANIQEIMDNPRLRYVFWAKVTERLSRTHMAELPRLAGWDQETLRDLRTPYEDE